MAADNGPLGAAAIAERELLLDPNLDDFERLDMLRQLRESSSADASDSQLQALEEHAHGGIAAEQVRAARRRLLGMAEADRLEAAEAQ